MIIALLVVIILILVLIGGEVERIRKNMKP